MVSRENIEQVLPKTVSNRKLESVKLLVSAGDNLWTCYACYYVHAVSVFLCV